MRKNFLETGLMLVVAALCWALTVWLSRVEAQPEAATQAEVARVQVRVQTALRLAAAEAEAALDWTRQSRTPFLQLAGRTQASLFVFHRDSLVWWSDHDLISDFDNVGDSFRYRAVESRRGKLLVTLRARGEWHALAYVPLESRYGISNRYLEPTLNPVLFGKLHPSLVIDEKALLPQVRAVDNTYLFSLAPDGGAPARAVDVDNLLPVLLLLLGSGIYVLAWLWLARALRLRGQFGASAATVLGALTALRVALLYWSLPFSLADLALFDPRYYAASWLAPSLGDQLLNAALLGLAATYVLMWYRRVQPARHWRGQLSGGARIGLALVCLGLMGAVLWFRYQLYGDTFTNSQLDLDVSRSVKLTWLHGLLALLLVAHSAVMSVALFVVTSIGSQLLPIRLRSGAWRWLLAGELLLWGAAFALGSYVLALGALTLLFAKGILLVDVRQRARGLTYPLTVFLFALVVMWAVVGAFAQQRHYANQRHVSERRLATNLLLEHDVLGEFLLEEVADKIGTDPLVERSLTGPFPQPEIARQKIEKYYLRDYFTQYETGVRFYDGVGGEMGSTRRDTGSALDQYRRRLLLTARATEHAGLYLVGDARDLTARRYVKLVRLRDVAGAATPPPTIVLELSLKKLNPYSVVPELLVDQKYAPTAVPVGQRFSYAVFGPSGLVASEGDFDYSGWTTTDERLRAPRLFEQGLDEGDAHHWAVRFGGTRRILVLSTPAYTFGDALSNFSFLFLLHLIGALLGGGLLALLRQRRSVSPLRATLSTKIQAMLNLGSLLPLLVVSVAAAGVSTRAYERDLVTSYQQRGERVQQTLLRGGRFGMEGGLSHDDLDRLTEDVAALAGTDILLYDPQGQLLVSSQSLLFETGVLSKLLNPEAVAALRERGQPRVLLTEHAGTLRFNALYLPLPLPLDAGTGRRVAGFIGIPFFDSEQALDAKLTDLVTTMMNIFTVMFIMVTFITFLVARVLTAPLKLLAEKLKQTTLTGQNERLAYEAPDEIGLLVGEYNQMLTKLEASRQELAVREKEAAWREMARQVAHEIKNPLTPMKLSLQYLQRAIRDGRGEVGALIEKVSDTLITQIDTLADIASSFSSFVSLPDPKPERVELLALLRHCLDLHPGTANTPVATEFAEVWVVADKNLLVRTFNNLVLNALQAVPADREAHVRASIVAEGEGAVCVGIHDNGTGIPPEVQPRVFVPNFSTKFSGSGIGLAVAKRAVEGAGGRIWFETKAEEGTTFYLTLPLLAE